LIDRGDLEPTTTTNVRVGEILDAYLRYVDANNLRSKKFIKYSVDSNLRPAFGERRVASLETRDFEAYRAERIGRDGVTNTTVNRDLSYLRAAFHLETRRTPSRVARVPHFPIVRETNARVGFVEYVDHYDILNALPRSLRALFVVAFHSGCRKGELIAMRWPDVDWRNRVIRLPKTKNGGKRNLPFWGGIEEHLRAQKAYRDEQHPECEHLFFWMSEDIQLDHGGVRSTPGAPIRDFRASWSNAVSVANEANPRVTPDLLFHDLRRSAVRVMVQDAGIPESQAMLISGHETQAMLSRYNIVSLKNVQDAGAKLDAWKATLPVPAPPA
jgi:integrase